MILNKNKGINIKDIEKDLDVQENLNRKIHITKQLARNYGIFIYIFNGLLYLDKDTALEYQIPAPISSATIHSGAKSLKDPVNVKKKTFTNRKELYDRCRNLNFKDRLVQKQTIHQENDTKLVAQLPTDQITGGHDSCDYFIDLDISTASNADSTHLPSIPEGDSLQLPAFQPNLYIPTFVQPLTLDVLSRYSTQDLFITIQNIQYILNCRQYGLQNSIQNGVNGIQNRM